MRPDVTHESHASVSTEYRSVPVADVYVRASRCHVLSFTLRPEGGRLNRVSPTSPSGKPSPG